ncbi:MAG: uncharacterized protein PWQ10_160 [Patescibacteria group bacterium]|nr:uncharacterized protein [Patescibacteria group bacterium]
MKEVVIDEYMDCICDLVSEEVLWSMSDLPQHADVSCLNHCFNVSFVSYLICKRLGFDYRSAARGGLLHDFFLYNWHETGIKNIHAVKHPRIALNNAKKYFILNKKEEAIIKKHMWPITIFPSLHKEVYVIMLVDKGCALMEVFRFGKRKITDKFS